MSLVKVSVETTESSDKMLHEIDLSKSVEENVKSICKVFGKEYSSVYGLKLISTNDGKVLHIYITDDNIHEIKDGYFLQLAFSVSFYTKRIFDHVDGQYKERSFQDLYELSVDPEFIKEIVKTEKHIKLMDVFTNTELSVVEATACLICIVHLFQKHYLNEMSSQLLRKVISFIKHSTHLELIKYALSVIHKVLCHRNPNFAQLKEEIITEISIENLTEHIKKVMAPEIQYGALLAINSLIRSCKGEKRQQLIKELNLRKHRENIYQHIIASGNVNNKKVDKILAHELYICQTFLLSIYAEALAITITDQPDLFALDEFELPSEVKKMTLLMDFDDSAMKNKTASIDNLLDHDDVRISLASMSSRNSEASRLSNRIRSTATSESVDLESLKPSLLTIEALTHYKKYHYKNFYQSQVEEHAYEIGILASSERVVKMLTKILHIGTEPDKSSTCYQPTIFTCSSKTPFFFELFSRTMWLLSKTRREMKASTVQDYEKVINVLGKQVRLVLESKPMDFKMLTKKMIETDYKNVVDVWQNEKKEKLKDLLKTHPSVQILKERFSKFNEKIVYDQRIRYIQNGTMFPKFNDKKINGNFKAKLSTNRRDLLINDYDAKTNTSGPVTAYSLQDITHVIEGKACPHVNNNSVKDPQLALSVVIKNDDYINFKAADRKTASYWLDALNLLLGSDKRSTYYKNELDDLTEMDVVLHLMELQTVDIPNKAPPIPQAPFEVRPPIPPKPRISISPNNTETK